MVDLQFVTNADTISSLTDELFDEYVPASLVFLGQESISFSQTLFDVSINKVCGPR